MSLLPNIYIYWFTLEKFANVPHFRNIDYKPQWEFDIFNNSEIWSKCKLLKTATLLCSTIINIIKYLEIIAGEMSNKITLTYYLFHSKNPTYHADQCPFKANFTMHVIYTHILIV